MYDIAIVIIITSDEDISIIIIKFHTFTSLPSSFVSHQQSHTFSLHHSEPPIFYINHYFLQDIEDVVTRVNEREKPLTMYDDDTIKCDPLNDDEYDHHHDHILIIMINHDVLVFAKSIELLYSYILSIHLSIKMYR